MRDVRVPEQEDRGSLSRRELLAYSAVGGALALTSCVPPAGDTPTERGETAPDAAAAPSFELEEITLSELQDAMAEGRLTATSITELPAADSFVAHKLRAALAADGGPRLIASPCSGNNLRRSA